MDLHRVVIAAAVLAGVAASALASVSITTTARPTYDARLMTIGQSLIDQITYTIGAKGLTDELIVRAVSPPVKSVEIIRRAVGGSFACHENDPNAGAGNYWVAYNGGTPTAGPLLTAAVNDITERVAAATQPSNFIFDQGQADAPAAAGNVAGVTAIQAATMYDACWKFAFAQLQTAMAGAGPVPIYIMALGRSCQDVNTAGWDALRKVQLAWISGGVANTVRVPDSYEMGLYGCVHPDRSYVSDYGRRFAYAVANRQYGGTAPVGPTIAGFTQPTATTVEVTLAAEAGDTLTTPLGEPWGFDFYDGPTLLAKTWAGWFSGKPRWTLPAPPADLRLYYLSGAGATPLLDDPARVIRGTTSRIPLRQAYMP